MLKKLFILFMAGVFMLNSTLVFSAPVVSLEPLIQEARERNPDILAAKKRWQAALARVPQAKSLENPAIGLSLMKVPGGTLKLNKTMGEDRILSVSQMLPFLGKLPLKGKIALVESQMIAAEYRGVELEVINQIKNVYYELFLNYKDAELNQQILDFLENIAKIAEASYTVNNVSQEEVLKVAVEIARLSNVLANLKEERRAHQTRLNMLLDRDPEAELGVPEIDEQLSFDKDIASLYQLTLRNQPEISIFASAIEKNKYAKSLAKKSFLPDMMAQIGLRGITSGGIGPWDLMLAFSVPFWFWAKQRYEVKEAIANLQQAEAAYQSMKNKALAQTKSLAVRLEVSRNKARLYKNNLIPLLENSLGSSLSNFRAGKGDVMILLDTQRMFVEAKISYYKSLAEYAISLSDLERNLGVSLKEVRDEK